MTSIPRIQLAASARSKASSRLKLGLYACLLVGPALLDVVVFRWLPLLVAVYRSLYQSILLDPLGGRFVGLAQYRTLLADPLFYSSLRTTIIYGLLRIPTTVVFGFVLALLVNRKIRGMGIVRTSIFLPAVTSIAVMSVIWNLMYQPEYGILNSILNFIGIPSQQFIADPQQALVSVAAVAVWQNVGFVVIVFLGSLQGIPEIYYEAARVDGAGYFESLRNITIPLLRRTFMYLTVVTTIFAFLDFAPIYVMTQGGPVHSTFTLIYYIFQSAFKNQDVGYANTLTVVFFLLLMVLAAIQVKALRSEFEY
jgi:ABC-type sugar transport system permease subunit